MGMFGKLYDLTLRWAAHRYAARYLAGLSFMESSFFPIPPDVMLVPMVLKQPNAGPRLAAITTIASVAGGLFGYLLGYFAFAQLQPLLRAYGYWDGYQQVVVWFAQWGFWVVFLAGFSPLPYKLFTIAAGALSLALVPFLVASAIGRGARFFLVAQLVAVMGPRFEPVVRRHIEWIGWATVCVALIVYWFIRD